MGSEKLNDMDHYHACMKAMPWVHGIIQVPGLTGDWMVEHVLVDPHTLGGFGIWQGALVRVHGETELFISEHRETVRILCDESRRSSRAVLQVLQSDVAIIGTVRTMPTYYRDTK